MKRYLITLATLALPLCATTFPVTSASAQLSDPEVTRQLQDALRRIAVNSNDSSALADAGLAALELGDTRAAIGFLAKADQIYPRSGRVKAGLGRALLTEENPFGALRYFEEAVANGLPLREIAADRGLALDLIGRTTDAQKDYEVALQSDRNNELIGRYAISLGISGNVEKAEATLAPLLQRSDRDAWRNRAFILAMNGREKDANDIAKQTMQREMARAIKPFFDRMPKLTAAQKAAAVHLGHFPASENIGVDVASVQMAANTAVRGGSGADAGLIPLGQPLGEPLGKDVEKPRVLAMPDKSPRRRPGTGRREAAERRAVERAQRKQVLEVRRGALPAPATGNVASTSKPVQIAEAVPAKPVVATPENRSAAAPGFETAISANANPKDPPVQMASNAAELSTKVAPNPALVSPPVSAPKPAPTLDPAATRIAEAQDTPIEQPSAGKPVQLVTFDLAKNSALSDSPAPGRAATTASQTSSVPPDEAESSAPVEAPRRALSDIIGAIEIPDAEKQTDIVPVDLAMITPATAKPVPPKVETPEPETKPEKAEPAPKKDDHPRRFWVQLATGSNVSALKYDFRQMKKKNAEMFGDMEAWTSDWGSTKRMVIGPFGDLSSAREFDATFRKNGGDSFAWVSAAGTEVTQLTSK